MAEQVAEESDELGDELLQKYNTRATRLRWMLDATMGAVGEFDRRRDEMAVLSGR